MSVLPPSVDALGGWKTPILAAGLGAVPPSEGVTRGELGAILLAQDTYPPPLVEFAQVDTMLGIGLVPSRLLVSASSGPKDLCRAWGSAAYRAGVRRSYIVKADPKVSSKPSFNILDVVAFPHMAKSGNLMPNYHVESKTDGPSWGAAVDSIEAAAQEGVTELFGIFNGTTDFDFPKRRPTVVSEVASGDADYFADLFETWLYCRAALTDKAWLDWMVNLSTAAPWALENGDDFPNGLLVFESISGLSRKHSTLGTVLQFAEGTATRLFGPSSGQWTAHALPGIAHARRRSVGRVDGLGWVSLAAIPNAVEDEVGILGSMVDRQQESALTAVVDTAWPVGVKPIEPTSSVWFSESVPSGYGHVTASIAQSPAGPRLMVARRAVVDRLTTAVSGLSWKTVVLPVDPGERLGYLEAVGNAMGRAWFSVIAYVPEADGEGWVDSPSRSILVGLTHADSPLPTLIVADLDTAAEPRARVAAWAVGDDCFWLARTMDADLSLVTLPFSDVEPATVLTILPDATTDSMLAVGSAREVSIDFSIGPQTQYVSPDNSAESAPFGARALSLVIKVIPSGVIVVQPDGSTPEVTRTFIGQVSREGLLWGRSPPQSAALFQSELLQAGIPVEMQATVILGTLVGRHSAYWLVGFSGSLSVLEYLLPPVLRDGHDDAPWTRYATDQRETFEDVLGPGGRAWVEDQLGSGNWEALRGGRALGKWFRHDVDLPNLPGGALSPYLQYVPGRSDVGGVAGTVFLILPTSEDQAHILAFSDGGSRDIDGRFLTLRSSELDTMLMSTHSVRRRSAFVGRPFRRPIGRRV